MLPDLEDSDRHVGRPETPLPLAVPLQVPLKSSGNRVPAQVSEGPFRNEGLHSGVRTINLVDGESYYTLDPVRFT